MNNPNHTLHLGDCLETMRAMPDNSVDLILTDPPYFKVKNEPWDHQWANPNHFLSWLDTVLSEFQRVLKPSGSLYLFASPKMAASVEVLTAERFQILNHIIWDKGRKSRMIRHEEVNRTFIPMSERLIFAEHQNADLIAGGHSGRSFIFRSVVDYLRRERDAAGLSDKAIDAACGWKTKAFHFFSCNMSNFLLPTEDNYASMQAAFQGYFLRDYIDLRNEFKSIQMEFLAARRPFFITQKHQHTDIWSFDSVNSYPGRHPCEKPQAMLQHIINASSRPGAVVLDAFMGTGSTGIAATKLGRDFIGCEMSPEYLEIARARIEAAAAPKDTEQFALL